MTWSFDASELGKLPVHTVRVIIRPHSSRDWGLGPRTLATVLREQGSRDYVFVFYADLERALVRRPCVHSRSEGVEPLEERGSMQSPGSSPTRSSITFFPDDPTTRRAWSRSTSTEASSRARASMSAVKRGTHSSSAFDMIVSRARRDLCERRPAPVRLQLPASLNMTGRSCSSTLPPGAPVTFRPARRCRRPRVAVPRAPPPWLTR